MKFNGDKITVEVYGTSHASEIGVNFSGFPKCRIDRTKLSEFMSRRSAKNAAYSTSRIEPDEPVFVSGVDNDEIVGNVHAVIYNKNVRSGDYNELYAKPRPSHADYAAYRKDGRLDFSGGGEFSGRLTAPLCIAGGIAKQILEKRGVKVCAYVGEIGGVKAKNYKTEAVTCDEIEKTVGFPALGNVPALEAKILEAKTSGDSVGGVVECIVEGFPAGVGNALFGGLESKISSAVFGIPAVKGVEFGDGFNLAAEFGSEANDPIRVENGVFYTETNRSGGINGGISNGMPITLSVAFRPTPSIAKPQKTVDLVKKENVVIAIKGRHDACIVPRAVPVVEAAVAIALLDELENSEK